MNHPYEQLADLVDGTLDEGHLAGVQAHLDTCAACRDDVAHATRGTRGRSVAPAGRRAGGAPSARRPRSRRPRPRPRLPDRGTAGRAWPRPPRWSSRSRSLFPTSGMVEAARCRGHRGIGGSCRQRRGRRASERRRRLRRRGQELRREGAPAARQLLRRDAASSEQAPLAGDARTDHRCGPMCGTGRPG